MCERYELKAKARAINKRFQQLRLEQSEMPRGKEMQPSEPVLILTASNTGYFGSQARWGLVGSFLDHPPRQPLINLHSEDLANKPFYSKILKKQRCLIPATAFYEWQTLGGRKQSMRISQTTGELLMLAGIFDYHPQAGRTCTLLTTTADESLRPIHHRMPLILDRDESAFWLTEHEAFPDAEFAAMLQAPSRHTLSIEPIIEAPPSPQLSLAFA